MSQYISTVFRRSSTASKRGIRDRPHTPSRSTKETHHNINILRWTNQITHIRETNSSHRTKTNINYNREEERTFVKTNRPSSHALKDKKSTLTIHSSHQKSTNRPTPSWLEQNRPGTRRDVTLPRQDIILLITRNRHRLWIRKQKQNP